MKFYQTIVCNIKVLIGLALFFLASCVSNYSNTNRGITEMNGHYLSPKEAIPLFVYPPLMPLAIAQRLNFSLNAEEREMYAKSVFFSLNQSETGSKAEWHSLEREVYGATRVIQTYHQKDKYCRILESYFNINGKEVYFTKNACQINGGEWFFY